MTRNGYFNIFTCGVKPQLISSSFFGRGNEAAYWDSPDFVVRGRMGGSGRRLEILDVKPLLARRRPAATAARAQRIAERQAHLESEVRAQEIRKVRAVRAQHDLHRVFAETEMIEQDVA